MFKCATTGEFVGLAEAKDRLNEARKKEMNLLFLERVLRGEVRPGKWDTKDDDELAADYRFQPTTEIGAELLRRLESVKVVACKS